MEGKVEIEAVAGKKLKKLEKFLSKQDPYVVFSQGGQSERTETHWDAGAEPRWKAKGLKNICKLEVQGDEIDIKVMNDNKKKAPTMIGEATLNISQLSKKQEMDVQLSNKGKPAGVLSLIVNFIPTQPKQQKEASDQILEAEEKNDAPKPTNDDNWTLSFKALRANKLKNLQMILAQDPYVKITLKNSKGLLQSQRTLAASGKNPTWNESKKPLMEFNLNTVPEQAEIEVFDAESFSADRLIGATSVPFAKLCSMADEKESQFALVDPKGKSAGTLFLSIDIPQGLRSQAEKAHSTDSTSKRDGSEEDLESGESDKEASLDADAPRQMPRQEKLNTEEEKLAEEHHSFCPGKLHVTVLEGIKLKKVQRIGQQDPYVKAELLPWKVPSGKTKTLSGRNPKWTSDNILSFDFPGQPAEGQRVQIQLDVFDEEMMLKDRLIGNCTVDVTSLLSTGKAFSDESMQVELQDKKLKDAGALRISLSFSPDLSAASRESSIRNTVAGLSKQDQDKMAQEGILTVKAVSAALTRSVEMLSKQDPFMVATLLPWGSKLQKGRTKAVSNAGKAVQWDEKHENEMKLVYPGKSSTGEAPKLWIQVYDEETFSSSRLIGEGTVDLIQHLLQVIPSESQKTEIAQQVELVVDLFYEKKGKKKPAGNASVVLSFQTGSAEAILQSAAPDVLEFHQVGGDSQSSQPEEELLDKTKPYELKALVMRGENLRNRAWFGKQDPYVKLTLLPWGAVMKTNPVPDGGTDVEWTSSQGNALSLPYKGARTDEFPMLLVEVWDQQMTGDRLIGSRRLGASCFLRGRGKSGATPIQVPLMASGGSSAEKNPAGVVTLSLYCAPKAAPRPSRCGSLHVTVVSMSTKTEGDWFGKTDPYVILTLTPGVKRSTQVKSIVQQNTGKSTELNQELVLPVFDFGTAGVGPNCLAQTLKVELFDKDTFTSDDLLGSGLKELEEILAEDVSGQDELPPEQFIPLYSKGKEIGNVYLRVRFVDAKFRGKDTLQGLRTGPGILRMWAIEARGLKEVGGMLDKLQDPYLKAVLQRPGAPDPGHPGSWKKAKRVSTADDAGKECIWNSFLDFEHTEADAAFAASGQTPGFLHVAVFDQGIMSDTLIGSYTLELNSMLSSLSEAEDSVWVSVFDTKGDKAGEIRVAAEFVPGGPKDNIAGKAEFAFVDSGTLHLFVRQLDGVLSKNSKKCSGKVLLDNKEVAKLAATPVDEQGRASWNHLLQIPWEAPAVTAQNEHTLPVPQLRFNFSGSSGGTFSVNHEVGTCSIPILAFVPELNQGTSVEKTLQLCSGAGSKLTYSSVTIVGIFERKGSQSVATNFPGILAAMSSPATESTSRQDGRRNSAAKPPPWHRTTPGRLHIRIVEAKNLTSKDRIGKQDPYVRGTVDPGGATFETSVCLDGGTNPTWTDQMENYHQILVEDAGAAVLRLTCLDKDEISDDVIGGVTIPILPISIQCQENTAGKASKYSHREQADQLGGEHKWQQLVKASSPGGEDGESQLLSFCTKAFSAPKWSFFCQTLFQKFQGGSSQGGGGHSASSRRKRLTDFYNAVVRDGIAEIEDVKAQVNKLENRYPNNDTVNKSLFQKLYKRYRPSEECPDSAWKGLSNNQGSSHVVNEESCAEAATLVIQEAAQLFVLDKNSLSSSDVKKIQATAFPYMSDREGEAFSEEDFAEVASLTTVELFRKGGIQDQQTNLASEEEPVPAAKTTHDMWWTLQNSKGKPRGLVRLQVWFTFDWVPSPKTVPRSLLRPGTLWVQICKATFVASKDWMGKQDPYFCASWQGGDPKNRSKKGNKVATTVKKNAGLAAEWSGNEGLMRLDFSPDLAADAARLGQTVSIRLEAKDKDVLGSDDILGETVVPLLVFANHQGKVFPRSLPLINTRKGETTRVGTVEVRFIFVDSPSAGEEDNTESPLLSAESETVEAAPSPVGGRMIVRAVAARELTDVRWFGKMEPQARFRFWPYNQTGNTMPAKGDDSSASWDESFTFDSEDLEIGLLQVVVQSGDTKIGQVELACTTLWDTAKLKKGGIVEDWFHLIDPSTLKGRGDICLAIQFEEDTEEDSSDSVNMKSALRFVSGPGTLHIRINRAKDMKASSLGDKRDPYVILKSEGWRKPFDARTPVDNDGGANPLFNYSCSADLEWTPTDPMVPSLSLQVMEKNMLKDSCIFETRLCLAPWLFCPGEIASLWLPMYKDSNGSGPYGHKKGHGLLSVDIQYIPKASFPGKPKSAFSRARLRAIAGQDEPREGDVHVQVIGARNLTDVQALGKQDPYVKLTLVGGGGGEPTQACEPKYTSAKTKQINNGGSNPKWDEDILLPYSETELNVLEGDRKSSSTPFLLVETWDANLKLVGDKVIGKTLFPLFPVLLDAGLVLDDWYPLVSSSGKKSGEIHLGIQFRKAGEQAKGLPSQNPENTLNVIVQRCKNLYNAGDGLLGTGAQDPQVYLEFVGHDQVYKTQVAQDQGTEPVFEERVIMQGCMPDARGLPPRLRVQVFDHDLGGDTFLGMCELAVPKAVMGDSQAGVEPRPTESWFQLLDRNQKEPRGEIQLILKRGPFPGDDDSLLDAGKNKSKCSGRVYAAIHSVADDLTNADGVQPRKPFLCAKSSGPKGSAIVESSPMTFAELTKGAGNSVEDGSPSISVLSIPLFSGEGEGEGSGEQQVHLGVYQRSWSLRGKVSKVVGECHIPKIGKLLTSEFEGKWTRMTLPLTEASANKSGLKVGQMDVSLLYMPKCSGKLQVKVVSVSGIKSSDMLSKNDLRVEVSLENGEKGVDGFGCPEYTSVKNNAGSSAEWNETKTLLYRNDFEKSPPELHIRVVDVDTVSNDVCAEMKFPILQLIAETLKKGQGAHTELEAKEYKLVGGGSIVFGVQFYMDSNVHTKIKKEESKQVMELKRMWNALDVNHDGRLTTEELFQGIQNLPGCADYLGIQKPTGTKDDLAAWTQVFEEMNTNDDDIVDYDEFRAFVESKGEREKQRRLREQQERQKARAAAETAAAREREKAALDAAQAERELELKRQQQKTEMARLKAEQRKLQEETRERQRKLREEKLAKQAEDRAMEDLLRAKEAKLKLAAESERQRLEKKRSKRSEKRPEDVYLWRTRDVVEWLAQDLELPQYCPAFTEAAVDGPLLVALTDEELEEQLGVKETLHRRKIMIRAARLFQRHEELTKGPGKKKQTTRTKRSGKTLMSTETATLAAGSGSNEITRLQIAQKCKEDSKMRKRMADEESQRRQIEQFEYDSGKASDKELSNDPLNWYKRSAEGLFACEESDGGSSDEESFREAMMEVRERLIASHPTLAEADHANHRPKTRSSRMLKIGEPVESESPRAKRLKSLPKEYWFEDRDPWWFENRGTESVQSPSQNSIRKLPSYATVEEALAVVAHAIQEFGSELAHRRKKETMLSSSTNPAEREKQMLRDTYQVFSQLRNNSGDQVEGLTRLKFFGAVKKLLRLDVDWSLFNAMLDKLCDKETRPRSEVSFEDFYNAFAQVPVSRRSARTASKRSKGSKMSPSKSKDDFGAVLKTLYAACETLFSHRISLRDLFRAFDRNGSGTVSVAEFSSMMKEISPDVSKTQIYQVLRLMDESFDRQISFSEFLDFWIVVFSQWVNQLQEKLDASNNAPVRLSNGKRVQPEELESLLQGLQDSCSTIFGRDYMSVMRMGRTAFPGPFSALLRHLGFGSDSLARSMSPLRKHRSPRDMQSPSGSSIRSGFSRNREFSKSRDFSDTAGSYRPQASEALHDLLESLTGGEFGSPRGTGLDAARAFRKNNS